MKKILIQVCLTIIFLSLPRVVFAGFEADQSAILTARMVEKPIDCRVLALEKFLSQYQSPLERYAGVFVENADKYQIDWKLVPAIAGVESTFGKHIPPGSFNAYGWNNGKYYFSSWEESIEVVTKTLKEKYINRGLTTPLEIAPVYAPPSSAWGSKVNYFMEKIQKVEEEIQISTLKLD